MRAYSLSSMSLFPPCPPLYKLCESQFIDVLQRVSRDVGEHFWSNSQLFCPPNPRLILLVVFCCPILCAFLILFWGVQFKVIQTDFFFFGFHFYDWVCPIHFRLSVKRAKRVTVLLVIDSSTHPLAPPLSPLFISLMGPRILVFRMGLRASF